MEDDVQLQGLQQGDHDAVHLPRGLREAGLAALQASVHCDQLFDAFQLSITREYFRAENRHRELFLRLVFGLRLELLSRAYRLEDVVEVVRLDFEGVLQRGAGDLADDLPA